MNRISTKFRHILISRFKDIVGGGGGGGGGISTKFRHILISRFKDIVAPPPPPAPSPLSEGLDAHCLDNLPAYDVPFPMYPGLHV